MGADGGRRVWGWGWRSRLLLTGMRFGDLVAKVER